jgi:D-alanine-D-alanine ligase
VSPVARTSELVNGRRSSRKSRLRVLLLVEAAFFDPSAPDFLDVTPDTESEQSVSAGLKALHHDVSVLPFTPHRSELRTIGDEIVRLEPDIVFNFIEHIEGDRRLSSRIPVLLEALGIPYTGSSAIGIASIDKAASKRAVSSVGFPVPQFVVLRVGTTAIPRRKLAFTVIVKSQFGGA